MSQNPLSNGLNPHQMNGSHGRQSSLQEDEIKLTELTGAISSFCSSALGKM